MTPGSRRRIFDGTLAKCLSLGIALFVWSGCATTDGLTSLFRPPESNRAEPWILPADSYPTQRLYRIKYSGPEGDAGFKLTLYLEGPNRYRLLASDLGRKLWSLSVDSQGEALWIDYRGKEYCRSDAASELRFVPLAELPLNAMPKLLLGSIPAVPATGLNRSVDRISFLDARGQLWNGGFAEEQLEWWSLVDSGEATVWWRREGRGGTFVDRPGGQRVSWTEIVSEVLEVPLAAVSIPTKHREGRCSEVASR